MNKDWPCECGHIRLCEETLAKICCPWMHEEYNDHKLFTCRYCDCTRYRPSNLRYLEQLVDKNE